MSPGKVVILGMMTRMPVGGIVWMVVHYLLGFRRLGYDVYYVETHGIKPMKLPHQAAEVDGSERAAAFIASVMRRFGFEDRWAYQARHIGPRVYGMTDLQLKELYRSADLIVNLHGGTRPLPEHIATGRLLYLETDPVQLELAIAAGAADSRDYLDAHAPMVFTWGLNYGSSDCLVPLPDGLTFKPSLPPIEIDLWNPEAARVRKAFTTVGNWRQDGSQTYGDQTYEWSKHFEFLKFLDLPTRSGGTFELALSSRSLPAEDRQLLRAHGWRIRDALTFSLDLDEYRSYIQQSRGEFTVAKDQNVRLRSGWFSDRSAAYMAAGRPVITQDTGFGSALPTGEGLFPFRTMEDILAARDRIESDYPRHSRAAQAIARDYFASDVVLRRLADDVGLGRTDQVVRKPRLALASDLVIVPLSRRPLVLPDATVSAALRADVPHPPGAQATRSRPAQVSIIVVTFENLAITKMCMESVLRSTASPAFELVVVDNGSTDGTVQYLEKVAAANGNVRLLLNGTNRGFAAANNRGIALAEGEIVVLLNNDVIVPPGWLERLVRHLDDPAVGLVGPVTNRIANEAQIDSPYHTYSEMVQFVEREIMSRSRSVIDLRMLAMFCVAMRRSVADDIGPIDERFEVGMLEDEDFAVRMRRAGYRVVCAEDVFVHHFGEASFGALVPTGEHGALYERNRRAFEEKWGVQWEPYRQRRSPGYLQMIERTRAIVGRAVPADATVLVVSRGDDELLRLEGRSAWHFPRTEEGRWAGANPADSDSAIRAVEAQRDKGAAFLLFPQTAHWWLDHYAGLRQHLESTYPIVVDDDEACAIFDLRRRS